MTSPAEGMRSSAVPKESVHAIVPEKCTNCPTFDARFPVAYLEHQVNAGELTLAEARSLTMSGLARCAKAHNCTVPDSDKIDPLTAMATSA